MLSLGSRVQGWGSDSSGPGFLGMTGSGNVGLNSGACGVGAPSKHRIPNPG